MKDFIFIVIMCVVFTFFISGLVYLHVTGINERIEQAYKKGFEDCNKNK